MSKIKIDDLALRCNIYACWNRKVDTTSFYNRYLNMLEERAITTILWNVESASFNTPLAHHSFYLRRFIKQRIAPFFDHNRYLDMLQKCAITTILWNVESTSFNTPFYHKTADHSFNLIKPSGNVLTMVDVFVDLLCKPHNYARWYSRK